MNARVGVTSLVLVLVCVGHVAPVGAHRLDEYLQATRLSVARQQVDLEIDLTAGIAVAPAVFAMIDVDRSGEISAAEGDGYARQVLDAFVLTVDGQAVRPRLEAARVPTWDDMSQGVGIIRLRASASLPAVRPGDHRLFFLNAHKPETSVYLANVLVPTDVQIEVTGQRRDGGQRELTIDYRVAPDASWMSSWPLLAGLVVAGVLGAALWRLPRIKRPVRPALR